MHPMTEYGGRITVDAENKQETSYDYSGIGKNPGLWTRVDSVWLNSNSTGPDFLEIYLALLNFSSGGCLQFYPCSTDVAV